MSDQPRESTVVAPEIAKKLEEERKERIIRHRAELFVELSKHPAWQEIVDEMERKRARMRRDAASVYFDSGVAVDQRQLDKDRGFAEGTRYMAAVVAAAQNTLDKLDKDAEKRAGEQTVTEPENETGGDWD